MQPIETTTLGSHKTQVAARVLERAEWRDVSGRKAKFYSLTETGRKQLKAEEADWERLTDAIGLILRTVE